MSILVSIWVVIALGAAYLNYGILFAYFQRNWPTIAEQGYRQDAGTALLVSFCTLIAPPMVLVSYCMSGFCQHGLMWSRSK